MHQRSKRVTLSLHLRKEKTYFLSQIPPCWYTQLSANSNQRGSRRRELGKGRAWGCEGHTAMRGYQQHQQCSPGCQQPTSFSHWLSACLHPGSSVTREGSAGCWKMCYISSPLQPWPQTPMSDKENAFLFSLKAIWLGRCPRITTRWMSVMAIISCFHLPFSYRSWMSMH